MSRVIAKLQNNILFRLYNALANFAEMVGTQLMLLFMRVWMAQIFWASGLTKIVNWESTVSLFAYEYKVPYLSPELAAYLATAFELICPVLLTIGLLTRFATLPMIVMTAVIQFTYFDFVEHKYWGILLFTVLFMGPGKISLDHLISKFLFKNTK